jgi:hypothetical protein
VSDIIPINGRSSGTRRAGGIPLETLSVRGCVPSSGSAFHSAQEPAIEDFLHHCVGGVAADLVIVDPH